MLLALFLLAGAFLGVLNLPAVTRELGRRVAEVASSKSGQTVHCAAAHVLPTGVELVDLAVEREGKRALSFESLSVYPDIRALFSGEIRVRRVDGRGFLVVIPPKHEDEDDGAAPVAEKSTGGSRREKILRLIDPAGLKLRLRDGRVIWGEEQAPRLDLPLRACNLDWVTPGQFPLRLQVELGAIEGKGGLTVAADVLSEGTATARVHGPGIPLDYFRPLLSDLLSPEQMEKVARVLEKVPVLPTIGGDFTTQVDATAKTLVLQGQVVAAGLTVQDERLASVPVGPVTLTQDVELNLSLDGPRLQVTRWDGLANKARYQVRSMVEKTPEGTRLDVAFDMNQTPYQDLVDSLPPKLAPAIEGVRIGGTLDLHVAVRGDLEDLQAAETEFNADWSRIRLEQPSEQLRGEPPLEGFIYRPESRDNVKRELVLGRGQPGWVTVDQLPRFLVHALLLSEDITFYHHEGFDPEGLKKAVKDNLKAGRAVRGGSTITQQLAKNLFLRREKTALRKLQEAVLAWELEKVLKKQQILEFYFNIIEWGPGVYGIGKASQHYFGKHPSDLSIREAAYLCTIIPNPIRYYMYFQRGELSEYWSRHVQALIDRMRAFEHLTEEEYQLASAEVLAFPHSPRAEVDWHEMEATDEAEQSGELPEEEEAAPQGGPLLLMPWTNTGERN